MLRENWISVSSLYEVYYFVDTLVRYLTAGQKQRQER